MPLERIDQIAVDSHGRPVRRVTRYVERRGGTTSAVVVAPPAPANGPPAADNAAGAPTQPTALPAVGAPPEVDLEDTATIRDLRAALGEVQARLDRLADTAGPEADETAEPDVSDALRESRLADTQKRLADTMALLDRRVMAIEDVLSALEEAASSVAGSPE